MSYTNKQVTHVLSTADLILKISGKKVSGRAGENRTDSIAIYVVMKSKMNERVRERIHVSVDRAESV